MATELVKRSIDGRVYEFEQFGAKQSLRVLMKLSKILGKPMLVSLGAMKKDESGKKLDEKVLGEAAHALFNGLDEEETIALIESLITGKVMCDGKLIKNFDAHYEDLNHMFNVLAAALDVQYGNFIGGLLGSLGLGNEAATTPVKSP